MSPTFTLRWRCLAVSALLMVPLSAYPQTTLTGAIQFATDSTGAFSLNQSWNTLGGDLCWDLWLAQNPDASSPVNGPSDAQAAINIPLAAGNSYRFYIFGAPDLSISFNGLNLFFDGDNSTPGISVFGATNSSLFSPNTSSGTRTLAGGVVAGSGTANYAASGVVAVLTGYTWNAPATPPGDVAQAFTFAPGGGVSFFGSFTLQVWPAAALSISQASGAPGTKLTMVGSGFAPTETVEIYAGHIGARPLFTTTTTDASGSFAVTPREPQHTYGPMDIYAVGVSSRHLGAARLFVTPALGMNPETGVPGGTTTAYGVGFGASETVDIYWNNPRQLLGTATANGRGSSALTITIPANASPGINEVIGVGQTTKAIGVGVVALR